MAHLKALAQYLYSNMADAARPATSHGHYRLPLTAQLALSLPDVLPILRPRRRQIILVIL